MVTHTDAMTRITVTLQPEHVELLDRMARVKQSSRSAELRGLIEAAQPIMLSVVSAFEAAIGQQQLMDEAIRTASEQEVSALLPELQRLEQTFLGVMSRLEGAAASAPASNTGATNS